MYDRTLEKWRKLGVLAYKKTSACLAGYERMDNCNVQLSFDDPVTVLILQEETSFVG